MMKDRLGQTSGGQVFLIKRSCSINLKFRLHQDDHWCIKHSRQASIYDHTHNVPYFSHTPFFTTVPERSSKLLHGAHNQQYLKKLAYAIM